MNITMILIYMNKKIANRLKKWLTFLSKPFIRLILMVITSVIVIMACIIVYRVDPSKVPITPPCSLRYFTGLYCPGCGMTRALHSALNLRFADAFSYNLLWPFILIFIAASFYMWFSFLITGKNPFTPFNEFFKKHSMVAYTVVIVLFAFWIFRNIPIYPFIMLAP